MRCREDSPPAGCASVGGPMTSRFECVGIPRRWTPGATDTDAVARRSQAAESATLKKREKGNEQRNAGARGSAEPFWLYEARMTVQRALIGRRGAVGATVFVGLVLLVVRSSLRVPYCLVDLLRWPPALSGSRIPLTPAGPPVQVMSTSISSIGLLQSYSYASALMEPTVRCPTLPSLSDVAWEARWSVRAREAWREG